jgi:glycosyltransferase involved in cell wall biosynthesis
MEFTNKVVYIISREDWGGMLMSKQHYAVELAKMGNTVFFINHPDQRRRFKRGEIKVESTEYKNLYAVSHRLFHPYFFKFKYRKLYYLLTSWHIKRLIKKAGTKPDVVWLFDIGNSIPLKYFPATARKIYMPVDGPYGTIHEKDAVEEAEIIVSVTDVILSQFKNINIPQYCINHGVAELFINQNAETDTENQQQRIGYSGSMVRNDLDIKTFLKIIKEHPDKIFEFWGENNFMKSSIHLPQDISVQTKDFLDTLHRLPNVILHGAVTPAVLAEGLKRMDALLICYQIKDDQNHHKVLEYLATGKVIVSSYMSSYFEKRGDLIEMVSNKENNEELPALFAEVTGKLPQYNSTEKINDRIAFASAFSYPQQIRKIEKFLTSTEA